MGRQRILCVVTVVAALVAATPAMAQRLSLGERGGRSLRRFKSDIFALCFSFQPILDLII